jgi:hypothetical protein
MGGLSPLAPRSQPQSLGWNARRFSPSIVECIEPKSSPAHQSLQRFVSRVFLGYDVLLADPAAATRQSSPYFWEGVS